MFARVITLATMGVLFVPSGCGSQLESTSLIAGASTRHASTVRPGNRQRYIYLSSRCCSNQHLYSYTYPELQPYTSTAGAYYGGCADSSGNVYFAGTADIEEFSNGATTPVKSLQIPNAIVWDCAVDPTTGNLAADVWFTQGSEGEGVEVFTNAQGTPAFYPSPMYSYSCTYDSAGDLFLVGTGSAGSQLALEELPKGGSSFEQISVNTTVPAAAIGIRWDGTYLVAMVPQRRQKSYFQQIALSDSTGTVVGTGPLTGHRSAAPSVWPFAAIAGGKIIDPTLGGFGLWRYPTGGNAVQTVSIQTGEGVVVSR